jgi:hypothetical protein
MQRLTPPQKNRQGGDSKFSAPPEAIPEFLTPSTIFPSEKKIITIVEFRRIHEG